MEKVLRQPVDTDSRALSHDVRSYFVRITGSFYLGLRLYPSLYLFLSLLKAVVAGGSGLAGTRMSPFWTLESEISMMELVVTTGAIRRAKLQSNHHHQQTNTQHFTGRMSFLSPHPTNSVKAL